MLHLKNTCFKTTALVVLLALVLLVGAAGCGDKETVTIHIGTQGYVEVEILGEMAKALIEAHTPYTAKHITGLGSAFAGYTGMCQNDLQVQTNFTGTIFLGNLEMTLTDEWRDPEKVYHYVKEEILKRDNLYAFKPFGYNNTYGIAVPRQWAAAHNVSKISDLEPYAAEMILAVDNYWKSAPGQGYPEFTALYGFEFKTLPEMDFALMYRSVGVGDVDAVCCYTTDGELMVYDLLVLEDDLGFNPPYNGMYVARMDMLEQYPEVKEALARLEGRIDTEQMQALNKAVAVDEKEPEVVARDFLKKIDLITD